MDHKQKSSFFLKKLKYKQDNKIKVQTSDRNNVVYVTNNNVQYYEKMAEKYAQSANNYCVSAANSANLANMYLVSCENLKNTIDDETMQLVASHSDDCQNPHSVTSEQVGAYSTSEVDELLNLKQPVGEYAQSFELENKNPRLVAGQNILISDNIDGTQTISSSNTVELDYESVINKPSINSIELIGDKSYNELGIATVADIPIKVSDLENDEGYLVADDISAKQDTLTAGEGINISENNEISSDVIGMPVGTIYPLNCTADYVPNGALPCDGAEYSKSQFTALWNNYLNASTPLLNTCTYTEYADDIATYGQCGKFAIDTTNETFKVPTIKDGTVIQQALTDDELGKSYNAGLPNIVGNIYSILSPTDAGSGNGAFKALNKVNTSSYSGSGYGTTHTFNLNLSRANSIYGNSDTVQPNAIALRYFVCVANGQINQSQMDWSNWASSLQGKLSTSGVTNATSVDGQWVYNTDNTPIYDSPNIADVTIDISNIIPKDGYNYEVLFLSYLRSSNTGFTYTMVENGSVEDTAANFVGRAQSTSVISLNSFTRIIDNNRIVAAKLTTTKASSGWSLFIRAYRRIGTNE